MTNELTFKEVITKINECRTPFDLKIIHDYDNNPVSELVIDFVEAYDLSQEVVEEIIEKLTIKNELIEFVFRGEKVFETRTDYKLFLHEEK